MYSLGVRRITVNKEILGNKRLGDELLDILENKGIATLFQPIILIKTFREFCLISDISLIAEGIETEHELGAFIELDVTYGQGR